MTKKLSMKKICVLDTGLEEHEELDNAEDEEEAAEGNDSEEEWEEELDLVIFFFLSILCFYVLSLDWVSNDF